MMLDSSYLKDIHLRSSVDGAKPKEVAPLLSLDHDSFAMFPPC